jgi:hypothetical protein
MTTLNGFTRPWDAFIQIICARKEKLQFDSLWEECIREESRVANRKALLSRKKSYFQKETHKESHPQNKFTHKESQPRRFQKFQKGQRNKKYFSSYQCYHCDKMGHIAKHYPSRREEYKKKNKRYHAHVVEDEEPPTKMIK